MKKVLHLILYVIKTFEKYQNGKIYYFIAVTPYYVNLLHTDCPNRCCKRTVCLVLCHTTNSYHE